MFQVEFQILVDIVYISDGVSIYLFLIILRLQNKPVEYHK